MTPGAIGQQIQKLEEWLGVQLFTRQIRQVSPTPDGVAYWQQIRPALAQIVGASQKLRDSRSLSVALSMPPTFAAKWFPRRMVRFLTRHPEIELRFNTTAALIDFERDLIDLAIRYFDGNDPQLDATLLYRDEACVYCSPAYAENLTLKEPGDLLQATLLHTTMQPYWQKWLHQFSQLDAAAIADLPSINFDQALMAIEAAKQGQGVVMTSPLLVEEDVATSMLVEPFGHRLTVNNGYYLVHPKKVPLRPSALVFKGWLIEDAANAYQRSMH